MLEQKEILQKRFSNEIFYMSNAIHRSKYMFNSFLLRWIDNQGVGHMKVVIIRGLRRGGLRKENCETSRRDTPRSSS